MKSALLTLFIFLFSTGLFAQAGTLNASFGNEGEVVTPFRVQKTFLTAIESSCLQQNGKILLAGKILVKPQLTIVRFLSNGIVDSTLGTNGTVYSNMGG